jgi:hypothetical protein
VKIVKEKKKFSFLYAQGVKEQFLLFVQIQEKEILKN